MRAVAGVSSRSGARARGAKVAAATLVCAFATPLAAQVPQPCPAGRIDFIFIDTRSIFDADDPALDARVQWAYRAANLLHVSTRESTVQRELLFAPGDCYDPFLLSESERLLRNFGVFARVDVFGVPQPDGNWHVIVGTRDEWSTQLDVRLRFDNGIQLEGVRLFEKNLLGHARTFGAFYFERDVTRDYGLAYSSPQMFRTRWDGSVAAGKTRAGSFVRSELAYPFLGEIGRTAGRIAFRREEQFFDYIFVDDPQLGSPHVLLPFRDEIFDASVVRRLGERGRTLLLGGSLTVEQLTFPGLLQVAPAGNFDDRVPADSMQNAAVSPQRNERENVRLSVLFGYQDIEWVKRRGLDSMRGEQDLRIGSEFGLVLGRTLSEREGGHDWLMAGTGYVGFHAFGGFWAGRARADARRSARSADPSWDDVLLDGELLAYFRRAALPRHTLVLRAAAAAAWHETTPFQLTLGGERSVRGYDLERFPGGRRVVFSIEDRIFVGWPWRDLFDTGLTVFADVGRTFPGDAPFGSDSGWRSAAGFGIRSSFPAGGRTTYRLDFAWPLDGSTRLGDVRLRFSVGEVLGIGQREIDPQLARARPAIIGGRLFDVRNR